MPEQVNGFSKELSDDKEIIYIHDEDGTLINAEVNRDGEWSVFAFIEGDQRQVQVASGLDGKDDAMAVVVDYAKSYEPRSDTANDSGGMAAPAPPPADGEGSGGLLSRVSERGREVAATAADATRDVLEPADDDDNDGAALGDLFDEPERDGPSAFEQLGDRGRDRDGGTPSLFDDTMQGSDGPSAFEQLGDSGGRDSGGPSAFEQLRDDRDSGTPSVFDDTMQGSDGPSAFDELGTDDEDTADRLERLQNAEDSGDLYGGNR
jgi:hypothetical protein